MYKTSHNYRKEREKQKEPQNQLRPKEPVICTRFPSLQYNCFDEVNNFINNAENPINKIYQKVHNLHQIMVLHNRNSIFYPFYTNLTVPEKELSKVMTFKFQNWPWHIFKTPWSYFLTSFFYKVNNFIYNWGYPAYKPTNRKRNYTCKITVNCLQILVGNLSSCHLNICNSNVQASLRD